jgi:hypothetical protein
LHELLGIEFCFSQKIDCELLVVISANQGKEMPRIDQRCGTEINMQDFSIKVNGDDSL